eukprot:TRINITY_DN65657_c2_g1_i1.p1 TRINITY_DN65657_c2_g1~~TRINITY_DN65657_c2_g1_i1.p1  ORF type:complete len:173 (-),score=17.92 TRINITY_DN65657_c2_g1_i1:173-691(-)
MSLLLVVLLLIAGVHSQDGRSCPALPDGTTGDCVEECSSDADCTQKGYMCCSNGCGHTCQASVPEVPCTEEAKVCPDGSSVGRDGRNHCRFPACPGETPKIVCPVLEADAVGACVEECTKDGDCTGGRVCCSNGCGHTCTIGVQKFVSDSSATRSTIGSCIAVLLSLYFLMC